MAKLQSERERRVQAVQVIGRKDFVAIMRTGASGMPTKEQDLWMEHFEGVVKKAVAPEFNKVNGRLDKIDGRLDMMDGRLDMMDGRLDKMDGRLDKMDGRLDKMDSRFDKTDKALEELTRLVRKLG